MEYIKLKDVSVHIKDGDWIESKDQSSEGIRLIQTGNIGEGRYIDKIDKAKFISDETFENLKCTEIFENDILISRLPSPVGRACLVPKIDGRAITAVDCTILKIDESKCLPKYFIYYSMSERYKRQIEKFVVGSTRVRISRKNLETIEVGVPSIEKQEKIVEVLDKAQSLIDKKREQIELLDELVKSRFVEMFGDPVLNTKEWEVKKVIDVCECMVPGRDKPKSFTGDIPWITIDDLKINRVTYKSKSDLGLTDDEIKEVKRKKIPKGSVLMSCVGNLGICSIAGEDMIINQQLHSFQCKEINNYFLMYYLGFRKDYMESKASSTTVLYMNKTVCNSIPVYLPPIELQNEFAEFVEQTDSIRSKMEASLSELEDNFNSLMQKAFKGELF